MKDAFEKTAMTLKAGLIGAGLVLLFADYVKTEELAKTVRINRCLDMQQWDRINARIQAHQSSGLTGLNMETRTDDDRRVGDPLRGQQREKMVPSCP